LDSTNKIKLKSNDYLLLSQNLINELTQIENNQKNNSETKLAVDKFSAYLKTIIAQFVSNKELLSNKIKEPSRSIELISTKEQLEHIKSIIEQANMEIKKHNEIVKNYQMEKKNLITSIWKYVAESYKSEIETYRKQCDGLARGITKLNEEYAKKQLEDKALTREIKDLTKNVTSVQPTIDEINRLLKSYGFLNFEITPSEKELNHYQIKREDGTLAEETLSEGEITFLTFLYFLQLTKGATDENKITDKKILVIDDPISSLDSNILFVVSTLIKEIIEDIRVNKGNIKQLILLTHNVYFHKEVSFINSRDMSGRNDTFFWILHKKNNISSFQKYEIKNPIQTSYQLLWQELLKKDNNSSVTIQNTMRRIIENYFKILGDYKDDSLISKFEILEEQIICKSLMSWINDGSHVIQDDLYIEWQDDVIDKYLEVFKKIFIFTNHEGHYNMMMKIENLGRDND
jgi:wobble nucleotide-excising tRNase